MRPSQVAQRTDSQSAESAVPAPYKYYWLSAIGSWITALGGIFVGYERFAPIAAPLWFRLIFLVCAVGCGVLGFFLGWEDLQTYRKERRALREASQQVATENVPQPIATTVDSSEDEIIQLHRG